MGRPQEAVAPTEEAVKTYRKLAKANPVFVPKLAMALNSLGVRYREVGRSQEAVASVEEAVKTYSELAKANPVFPARPGDRPEQPRKPLQRGGAPSGGGGARRGGRQDVPRG